MVIVEGIAYVPFPWGPYMPPPTTVFSGVGRGAAFSRLLDSLAFILL